MNTRAVVLQLTTAAALSSFLLPLPVTAVEPEKQPIYFNIISTGLCGTDSDFTEDFPPSPCPVPAGRRLVIQHVSGYAFLPTSTKNTVAISLVITDPKLGLNQAATHTFVATKTSTGRVSDTFVFNQPFNVMLNPGTSYFFSPSNNAAVSGYLVRE
jgi:hypothetical protein